jgi:MFS family permease
MKVSLGLVSRNMGMKTVLQVGLITAIAGMSDGFLYAYLPVKGEALGFTPIMIGVLLSMNRFVRFFTNRFVAFFANKIGVKKIYIIGILLSFVVSITYAFSPVFAFWVIARAIWGLCFSILRFSKLQYVSVCDQMGTALGWSASIGGIIQIIAYFIGPILIALTFDGMPFIFFGFALLLFLPLLFRLPDVDFEQQDIKLMRFQLPNRIDIWGFITNFSLDGMLIVGLSKLLKLEGDEDTLLFYTAFFISIRRAIGIIFAPLVGTLVDRFGLQRAFNVEVWFLVVGMALIMVNLAPAGLIIIFIGATANQNITPLLRINTTPKKDQFSGITRLTSSQDMGSALGALLGLSLIIHLNHFYLFMTLGVILLLFHWFVTRFIKQHLYQADSN